MYTHRQMKIYRAYLLSYISIGLNGLSTISGLNVLATIKDLLGMVGGSEVEVGV